MSKRLQVLVDEPELRKIQALARAQSMTVAGWVRQALRQAQRLEPAGRADKKVAILRTAVRHDFPSGDMATMSADIERGYGDDGRG